MKRFKYPLKLEIDIERENNEEWTAIINGAFEAWGNTFKELMEDIEDSIPRKIDQHIKSIEKKLQNQLKFRQSGMSLIYKSKRGPS